MPEPGLHRSAGALYECKGRRVRGDFRGSEVLLLESEVKTGLVVEDGWRGMVSLVLSYLWLSVGDLDKETKSLVVEQCDIESLEKSVGLMGLVVLGVILGGETLW